MNLPNLFLILCLAKVSHAWWWQADSGKTIEYRSQYRDWSPLGTKLLDLSCTHLKTPIANETLYKRRHLVGDSKTVFSLFQKIHFPFKWVPMRSVNLGDFNLLISGHDNTGEPIFLCRSGTKKHYQVGMVTSVNKECQLYNNGSLTTESNYDLLMNPESIGFSWVNVSTWAEIPEDKAFVLSRLSRTESQLIGRIVVPEMGPIITEFRQNVDFKVNQNVSIASSLELENSTTVQVLVEDKTVSWFGKEESPEYYLDIDHKGAEKVRLACQAATEELNPKVFSRTDYSALEQFDAESKRNYLNEWALYKKVDNSIFV